MLTQKEIQELLNIIDKNSLFFIASQLGKHLLLPEDETFLKSQGINITKIASKYSPIEQAYLFGHISTLLKTDVVKKMTFNEFSKYLVSDKWLPLVNREKESLAFIEKFAYNEIKGLGNRYKQKLGNIVVEFDEKLQRERELAIKEGSKTAIERRETKNWLGSELRKTTEDWNRDWGRVSDYIMTSAYSKGSIEAARKRDGEEAKVWMSVYPQACKHCIKAYLTDGIGSRPKVFLVSDLEANGTNIGRTAENSLAVIPPYHPNCRCDPNRYVPNSEWDDATKSFKEKEYKSKYKPLIKVKIDGKEYEG